jgi:CTP synthase
MIIARSDYPVDVSLREKIALFCDVDLKAVVPMETAKILYEVPSFWKKHRLVTTY